MWRQLLALFRRERMDRELSDEVEFHLAMLAEEKAQLGLSPEESLAAARREFGNVGHVKESHRERRTLPLLESLLADSAHAARMMRRNPLFTVAVTATLAVGIGATTAVFTVASAVLLTPFQVPSADRTVVLLSTSRREGTAFSVAEGVFADWRERSGSFEAVAGCWDTRMILSGASQPHEVSVVKATADFFPVVGLQVREGRLFDSSAEMAGHEYVAVLDEGFWRREFGARRDVLGGRIILNDHLYTVVGVAESGFSLGHIRGTEVWVPLVARPQARGGGSVDVIARMRPGVSRAAAQAEMEALHDQVRQEHREDSAFGVEVRSLYEWVVAAARPAVSMLVGAVALLMLMCCVNIANLLLARASVRRREFAIRASLGGGHARLAGQVLTESLLLAVLGGAAGSLLAVLLVRAVPYIPGLYLPGIDAIQTDGRMLSIASAITLASGLLFGIVPAWRCSIPSPRALLGALTSATANAGAGMRLRRALIVAQLGFSLVLLCGAALLLNSFVRLATVRVGFSKANVVAAAVRLPHSQYDPARALLFHRRLMEEVRDLPGVVDVSAADFLPFQSVRFPYRLSADGHPSAPTEAMARNVEPRYFRVLGIPIVAGREFDPADDARSPVPVILSVETARRLFGQERDALGRSLRTNYRERTLLEVIGVASNVRQLALREDPGPQIYLPMRYGSGGHVIARVAENAGDLSAAIRDRVFRLDPSIPAPEVSTVRAWFEREVARPRLYLLIVGGFALVGLLMATMGVYGVVAYAVAQRTHEFGIRLALGARKRDILRLVLAREVLSVTAGVAIGAVGALGTARLWATLLYGVRPNDASTLMGACLLLAGTALLACYGPARRAARLDPATALRDE